MNLFKCQKRDGREQSALHAGRGVSSGVKTKYGIKRNLERKTTACDWSDRRIKRLLYVPFSAPGI